MYLVYKLQKKINKYIKNIIFIAVGYTDAG